MPETKSLTFDGLAHPVAVTYDPASETVGVYVDGNFAGVFVGELTPEPPAPVLVAEPIPDDRSWQFDDDPPVALASEVVTAGNISDDEVERVET